jgi:hypothetical protein
MGVFGSWLIGKNGHPGIIHGSPPKALFIDLGEFPLVVVGLHHVTGIRGFLPFDPDLIRLHGEVLFGRLRLMGRYYQESFEAALKVPERLVIE